MALLRFLRPHGLPGQRTAAARAMAVGLRARQGLTQRAPAQPSHFAEVIMAPAVSTLAARPASASPSAHARRAYSAATAQLERRGVDPEHVLLALAGVALWRVWRFARRVARLERKAEELESRLEHMEHALLKVAHVDDAKDAHAVTEAVWSLGGDFGKGIKLPW
jgi:hypothetical protein